MRKLLAALAAALVCLALAGTPALTQEESDGREGGTGLLAVTVEVAVPWERIAGKELQGWVGDVDGSLSATIPGPSADPRGPGTGETSWLWVGSVTAQLDLDGQPVHLAPDIHGLMLALGDPGCYAGWDSTCLWWCWTGFELRPDEDIWFQVTADLQGELPVSGRTCPVDMVTHRAWVPAVPVQ